MLREIHRLMIPVLVITISGAGCLAGGDGAGPEAPEAAAATPASGQPADHVAIAPPSAPLPRKPVPVRPLDPPGVVIDGTLPPKPAGRPQAAFTLDTAWTVFLTASSSSLWPTQYTTLTATTNMDVGPTPYYIRIYSLSFSTPTTLVASCGFGTTCTVSVTQPMIQNVMFQATIEDSAGTSPALDIAFGDNLAFVNWHGSGVTLTASPPTAAVGGTVTLSATTVYDIGPSPFYVELFDATTGTFLTACGTGTACSAAVSQAAATTHAYQACFSGFGTSYPPPGLLECTVIQYATWSSSGSSVSLTAPARSRSWETVTATASFDVGPTPYFIQIYDIGTGRITSCGAGTTCTTNTFTPSAGGSALVAFIAPASTTLPPPMAVAQSATVYTILNTSPE
jgi:hypothetical protein